MRYEFELPGGIRLAIITEKFAEALPMVRAGDNVVAATPVAAKNEPVVYFALPGAIADRMDRDTTLEGMEWRERRRGKGKQVLVKASAEKAKNLLEQLKEMSNRQDMPDYLRHTARETISQIQRTLRKAA